MLRVSNMLKTTGCSCAATNALRSSRSYGSRKTERQVEKRKCVEGHVVSSMKEHVGWSEKLASFSEAAVKADQTLDRSFDDLQEMTLQYLQTDCEEPVIAAGDHYNTAGTTLENTDIDDEPDENKDYYDLSLK